MLKFTQMGRNAGLSEVAEQRACDAASRQFGGLCYDEISQ